MYFEAFNRGKRSLSLDLRLPAAREVLEDLVRESDCVFANLRGTGFAKLRLRHADLQAVNAAIVCCSLSGFGLTGPRAAEGAYDHVVQALSGWMALTGGPDDPPLRSGVSMADYAAGYVAALAMVAGVWQARRTGRGVIVTCRCWSPRWPSSTISRPGPCLLGSRRRDCPAQRISPSCRSRRSPQRMASWSSPRPSPRRGRC